MKDNDDVKMFIIDEVLEKMDAVGHARIDWQCQKSKRDIYAVKESDEVETRATVSFVST